MRTQIELLPTSPINVKTDWRCADCQLVVATCQRANGARCRNALARRPPFPKTPTWSLRTTRPLNTNAASGSKWSATTTPLSATCPTASGVQCHDAIVRWIFEAFKACALSLEFRPIRAAGSPNPSTSHGTTSAISLPVRACLTRAMRARGSECRRVKWRKSAAAAMGRGVDLCHGAVSKWRKYNLFIL